MDDAPEARFQRVVWGVAGLVHAISDTLAARFEKDGQVYRKEVVVTLEAGQLTEVERICLYECPEGVAP